MIDRVSEWWQSIPTIAQQVIIGLIVVIITYIFSFPIRKLIIRSLERKKKHDDRLKVHFEDLRKEAQDSIISKSYSLGRDENLYIGDKSSLSFPFECHFLQEAREWEELITKAQTHNKEVNDFKAELEKTLERKTSFPISDYSKNPPPPVIYTYALEPLFDNWNALVQGRKLSFDFAKATIERKIIKQISVVELRVNAYLCGDFNGSAEAESCRSVLIAVQNDSQLTQKAIELRHNGQDLEKSFTEFKDKLRNILDDIEKYELGKKFKKLKNCPICQKF